MTRRKSQLDMWQTRTHRNHRIKKSTTQAKKWFPGETILSRLLRVYLGRFREVAQRPGRVPSRVVCFANVPFHVGVVRRHPRLAHLREGRPCRVEGKVIEH